MTRRSPRSRARYRHSVPWRAPALEGCATAGLNKLYYGDNLDVLRRHVEDESVDLVYLDPPFNSNASYNVLFAEKDGTQAASQIKAFEDTWDGTKTRRECVKA